MNDTERRDSRKRRRRVKRELRKSHSCYWCGERLSQLPPGGDPITSRPPPARQWATLHYLTPRSEGGTWNGGNVVLACFPCTHARYSAPGADPAQWTRLLTA